MPTVSAPANRGVEVSLKTDQPAAIAAVRLRKPSWKDPRLLIGLLLVCLSIAGVVAIVDGVDSTTDVYAAREDLPVGTELSEKDLQLVPVRLGDAEGSYLVARDGIPNDAVVQRLIRKGELVPASGIGTADALDRKPVGLTIEEPLPTGTSTGDRVDVWVSTRGEGDAYREPELLMEGAEIYDYTEEDSALGASQSVRVFVLVDDTTMPKLLSSLSNEARIALVVNAGAS